LVIGRNQQPKSGTPYFYFVTIFVANSPAWNSVRAFVVVGQKRQHKIPKNINRKARQKSRQLKMLSKACAALENAFLASCLIIRNIS
jgi:hypothetical protein